MTDSAPPSPEPAALLAATRFRDRLGGLLVGGFIGALLILFWVPIPETNEQLITYMIGQLSGFAGGVVAYHYTMNALNVQASNNTGKMADAIVEAAKAGTGTGQGEKGAAADGAAEAAAAAEAEAERLRQEAATDAQEPSP